MRKPTRLKLAIVMSGRRQKDIAAEVGMDEAAFSRVVNGLHTTEDRKHAIATALGTNADDLWPDEARSAA